MEVPDPDWVYAQATAGCVAGPCAERRGQEHDEQLRSAAAAQEHEQGGVKAAYQQGKDWSGADRHAPSIGKPVSPRDRPI